MSSHGVTRVTASELKSWDSLYASGSVDEALRYSSLLWPDFVEAEGMIFLLEEQLAQPELSDISGTLKRFSSKTEMEKAFNVVAVPFLFASASEADEESLAALAAMLCQSWTAKLQRDYPGRRFVVEVLRGDADDPSIRFYTGP